VTQPHSGRRRFLKRAAATTAALTLGAGGIGYYAWEIEPRWWQVNPVSLQLPRLSPAFNAYRIVQISDLHTDTWATEERLFEVAGLVNAQKPNLIVITGDFVTHTGSRFADQLIAPLRSLRAPDGILAVLGNHDHWLDARMVRGYLQTSGVKELPNSVYTLERGGDQLHIAGVDDIWERMDRLDQVLNSLPDRGAAILLAHEPDFADTTAATGRFDLQLSGHTHGGQIRLPFIGAPVLPAFGEKYVAGLYRVGTLLQYTNRGIGGLRFRGRWDCRPEITVFDLTSQPT
jgi:predicted MPP superfamily phosphohydrolase